MEIKIAFVVVASVIIATSFWGFLHRWTWQKIVKRSLLICAITTPLLLLDDYRIFIISILLAVIFEFRKGR